MKHQTTLNAYLAQTVRDNWGHPALTNIGGDTYTYADVAERIEKLHIAFSTLGLGAGDKIAFCGRNSAEMAICMLASITYGTVSVPILHDFTPDTVHHLVAHSEAKVLFTDTATWNGLDHSQMPDILCAVQVTDYAILYSATERPVKVRATLNELFAKRHPASFTPDDIDYANPDPDEICLINYTSGSAGFSKGVMLSYRSMWSNLQYTIDGLDFLKPGDNMLCMLPMAHMFGLMEELLHTFNKGCHLYFLTRTPSPAVLLGSFAEVRPKLVIAVPLIIEKMVRSRVFPLLRKAAMRLALLIPGLNKKIYAKIRARLIDVFGGNLLEVIIGGAPLSHDVDAFLRKIRFPFTVGYGMTECGPLITYAPWDIQRPGSCGKCVDRMELKIESDDPAKVPGVLWVRGDNVMSGYYKAPEITESTFRDGWMATGDICQLDSEGYLYIRGRDKNMILGPSGQNIYPEEIEQVLANLPYVGECLAVERGGKIVGLVHPDYELAEKECKTTAETDELVRQNLAVLNRQLPSYSRVSEIEIMPEEFEKTPKRSIRRYLYMEKK